MKKVLIISPLFPPINAADMQRVRMNLPYYKTFDWEPTVVSVKTEFVDMAKDELLLKSLPHDLNLIEVHAFSKKWTSKIGLGSVALRSMWYYFKKINTLLKKEKFDLIYFSTTQFPLMILGNYWKNRFKIPYVIDMQDPWHSDYYEDKPKHERPPKYWFSYRLNKYLEPIAMKGVGGLISVSKGYLDVLESRYSHLKDIPKRVITFGAFLTDFDIVKDIFKDNYKEPYPILSNTLNLVYIGRGGHDMQDALKVLFTAFKKGLNQEPNLFKKLRIHFIGTSYAPNGTGKKTILPYAKSFNLDDYITENTNRLPFFESIKTLQVSDALLIIGSNDPQYTASKIYPYILAEKPLIAFFHPSSSANQILTDTTTAQVISIDETEINIDHTFLALKDLLLNTHAKPQINWEKFNPYTAKNRCQEECELFNQVIN